MLPICTVAELMVAIEIDDGSHAEPADHERQRAARLNQLGIEVIGYANRDIMTNLGGVYEGLSRRIMGKRMQTP